MKETVMMELPLGYTVLETSRCVPVREAENILCSRSQYRYSKAIRNGDMAELVRSYFVCPHCGKRIPVCRWELREAGDCSRRVRVSGAEIRNWSSSQLSFLEDTNPVLTVGTIPRYPLRFRCPLCEELSEFSQSVRRVIFETDAKTVTLKTQLLDVSEVLSLSWNKDSVSLTFPLYETLTFCFQTGTVVAGLETEDGTLLSFREITHQPRLLSGSVTQQLFGENKLVRRMIRRLFSRVWGTPVPFMSCEITADVLFRMTMFQGYGKSFYHSIPYNRGSLFLGKSFSEIATLLREVAGVPALYETSSLPQVKSVRRLFFTRPELFFYLGEAEALWQVTADVNRFCSLMKSPFIFQLLSTLHTRPQMIAFVEDFCWDRGVRAFLKWMNKSWEQLLETAVEYISVNEETKEAIRAGWASDRENFSVSRQVNCYAVPMGCPKEEIPDCTVMGYQFFWLRNTSDYQLAGENLHNCLVSWTPGRAPVVCVKRNDRYLAALEIDCDTIVQARGYENNDIEEDSPLSRAITLWSEKFGLTFLPEEEYPF